MSKWNYESWSCELPGCNPPYTEDSFDISESTKTREVTHDNLFLCMGFLRPGINTLHSCAPVHGERFKWPLTLMGHTNERHGPRCLQAKTSLLILLSQAFPLVFSYTLERSPLIFMTFVSFLRYLSSSVCDKHPIAAEKSKATLPP